MANIIDYKNVDTFFKTLGRNNIVVAGGCFDLLHIGHITLLTNAKKQGDFLVVLIENDRAIKKRKGINRPIHSQKERAGLVAALRAVDLVILLPENMTNNDYDQLLQMIKPSIIATTENDIYIEHKKRQAEKIGAKLVEVNKYIPSVSTTKLLDVLSKEM